MLLLAKTIFLRMKQNSFLVSVSKKTKHIRVAFINELRGQMTVFRSMISDDRIPRIPIS